MTNVVWYKILTTLEKTTTSNCIYRVGNEEHKESNELDRESERWRIEGQASRRARLNGHFRQGIRSILFVKHSKSLPLLEAKTGLKLKFHFSLIIAFSWVLHFFFLGSVGPSPFLFNWALASEQHKSYPGFSAPPRLPHVVEGFFTLR